MTNSGDNIQKRCYDFALNVVRIARSFPKNSEGFALAGQLIRSSTSIPANLFEGSAGVSRKEFIQFISIARKSAVETQFWIKFVHDLELIQRGARDKLEDECGQIVKILSKIILNAKKNG